MLPQPRTIRGPIALASGNRSQGIPDYNPLNPKYRPFIAAWKRLPLPLANVLGRGSCAG